MTELGFKFFDFVVSEIRKNNRKHSSLNFIGTHNNRLQKAAGIFMKKSANIVNPSGCGCGFRITFT
jgi:hypothetical protein